MQKSVFIDYARGFSILTIVIYHLTQQLTLTPILRDIFSFGGAGVHLFFFASGYGLGKSKYTTYIDFLKRRLNKVLIPYYITVTFIFLINLLVKVYPFGLPAYLSHIFLYKMFVPQYEESFGAQLWFISTIVQFYLAFPLLLWLLKAEKYKVFFISTLLVSLTYSLIIALSPYANERVFNGFFIQYLWSFALGMVIAKTDTLDKAINQPIFYYIITAVICLPLAGFMAIKYRIIGGNLNDVFVFLAYTSIVIILYRTIKPLNKIILWITGFSYALYLVHMFIFNCFYKPFMIDIFRGFTLPLIFIGILLFSYYYNILLTRIAVLRTVKSPVLYKDTPVKR